MNATAATVVPTATRVLVACDSFKGTMSAYAAGSAIRAGWHSVRPEDTLRLLPFADGGEGTLEALELAVPGARLVTVEDVTGPDGTPHDSAYLLLPDGTAVVEFAQAGGLPMMRRPDALGASSRGVGEVIAQALSEGARRLVIGLGGSASSDGGAGLLRALGLAVLDRDGWCVPPGAAGLLHAARVDASNLTPPPPGGVLVLSDVVNPLLGPDGAAAVFGPQKGAGVEAVAVIEHALELWAGLIGAAAKLPGGGAAGGTAAGLAAVWGAELTSGSAWIAREVGLESAVGWAEVVVTGEGRFDATSLNGKAVGLVVAEARRQGKEVVVVAGSVDHDARVAVQTVEVARLAGSREVALSAPAKWVRAAGAAAGRLGDQGAARRPTLTAAGRQRPPAPSAHG